MIGGGGVRGATAGPEVERRRPENPGLFGLPAATQQAGAGHGQQVMAVGEC